MASDDRPFCEPPGKPEEAAIFLANSGRRSFCPSCGMSVAVNKAGDFARHRP